MARRRPPSMSEGSVTRLPQLPATCRFASAMSQSVLFAGVRLAIRGDRRAVHARLASSVATAGFRPGPMPARLEDSDQPHRPDSGGAPRVHGCRQDRSLFDDEDTAPISIGRCHRRAVSRCRSRSTSHFPAPRVRQTVETDRLCAQRFFHVDREAPVPGDTLNAAAGL